MYKCMRCEVKGFIWVKGSLVGGVSRRPTVWARAFHHDKQKTLWAFKAGEKWPAALSYFTVGCKFPRDVPSGGGESTFALGCWRKAAFTFPNNDKCYFQKL